MYKFIKTIVSISFITIISMSGYAKTLNMTMDSSINNGIDSILEDAKNNGVKVSVILLDGSFFEDSKFITKANSAYHFLTSNGDDLYVPSDKVLAIVSKK